MLTHTVNILNFEIALTLDMLLKLLKLIRDKKKADEVLFVTHSEGETHEEFKTSLKID